MQKTIVVATLQFVHNKAHFTAFTALPKLRGASLHSFLLITQDVLNFRICYFLLAHKHTNYYEAIIHFKLYRLECAIDFVALLIGNALFVQTSARSLNFK